MADTPVAYWPCNDSDTTCRDVSGGGRNLTHTVTPAADPMFGRSGTGRASASPSAFTWVAVSGWFYFPAAFTSASGYKGFVSQASGHQNLGGGNNVTGSFSNEILTLSANSGNAFRAWDSSSGSIPSGWHQLFASYRAGLSRWEIFVDAVAVSNANFNSVASSLSSGGSAVYIGSWSDGTTGFTATDSIKYAHVAYFGAEVSDTRIMAQYRAGIRSGVSY